MTLAAAALAVLVVQSASVLPLGYHERQLDGWSLLAVSVPIHGYTVCLMDRPATDPVPVDGEILHAFVAGHGVERLDGTDAVGLVQHLVTHAATPGTRRAALSLLDRHLLALAGERWRELGAPADAEPPGAPTLLLAGSDPPEVLMEALIRGAGSIPRGQRNGAGGGDEEPARERVAAASWWRHVPRADSSSVAVGLFVPVTGPELDHAARIARMAALDALRLTRPGFRTSELRVGGGTVFVLSWPAPADSVPAIRRAVVDALAGVRRSTMARALFDELRARATAEEQEAIRNPPSRWFLGVLAARLGGARPRAAHDAGRTWKRVTRETVREAARTVVPHDVFAVSIGAAPAGAAQPTERWPRPEIVYADALEERDRRALAASSLARAAARMWRAESAPAALSAESEWVLVREGGPLTGRLVETLLFPDTIRRDYYPAGPDLVFSTWLVADSVRAAIQGAPRDTLPGERTRLSDRRDADAWNAVRTALESDETRRTYEGVRHVDGEVFQSVTVQASDHVLRLYLDPETGVPERVFIDRGPRHVMAEYRFSEYANENGYLYPGRIERHAGVRREAVLTVRTHAPASRLAASERLQ